MTMRPVTTFLARAGYAARGVLSCTIGVLAVMAALGTSGGKTTDSKGALREIYAQPFGQVLLGIVAAGLFGYSVWLFVQGIVDPERSARRGKKGVLVRLGRVIAGLLHVGLGIYATSVVTGVALGDDDKSGDEAARSWTARLLGWDSIGVVIVAAFGVFVIGLGVWDIYKAAKGDLDDRLDLSRLSAASRKVLVDLSRFGLAARAVVFLLIGAFFILAGVSTDPRKAHGLAETLGRIRELPFGRPLLFVVAFGFVAYGLFQVIEARYRRIRAAA